MKVLVTDGDNRAALAITRSLGRAGHRVLVGFPRAASLAGSSRYCFKRFVYPDPHTAPSAFSERLLEVVRREKPDVIMPVAELTTILVTEHADSLRRYSRIPFPDGARVRQAADKAAVLRLALQCGVPIPDTVFLDTREELAGTLGRTADALGYPVVLKTSRSRFLDHGFWRSGGASYAGTPEEMIRALEQLPAAAYPVLLQKRVVGAGVGIFVLADRGKIVSLFSHRRLREKPPSGGVSVLRESFPLDRQLLENTQRLVEALKWHGVGMVEFKQDASTGLYRLMEINGRFWGSLQLAIDAGVDFPLRLLHIACGRRVAPDFNYRLGVRTRWFWGDVDALLSRLIRPDRRLKLPPGFPGRLQCLLNFMKPHARDQKFEVLDFDDLRPFLFESLRWVMRR